MIGTIAFHLLCYFSVNWINNLRPTGHLWDLSIAIDHRIPYLGWTCIFYYIGVPYMSFWAFYVMWNLPDNVFRSALPAYLGMIAVGAATQLLFPARSPWPATPVPFQSFMHARVSYDPYVCLPSMHVALSVLPAGLSLLAFRSRWIRAISLGLAVLITASTLTLKEHYFLDTIGGLVLGLATFAISYRYSNADPT
jgi:membrane-associated phospholipid phosphatase